MDHAAVFFKSYPFRTLEANSVILRPNEEPAGIYYLASGMVRQYDIGQDGKELVVNTYKPGAYFPMSASLGREPNRWYFETIKHSKIHIAPDEDVIAELKQQPEMMFDLLLRVCSGAAGQQRRLVHLMGGTARTRVIFELIVQFQRFGEKASDGTVRLDISEAALAKHCGLSRESVSKELTKLRQAGLIKRRYKVISTSNIDVLSNDLGQLV